MLLASEQLIVRPSTLDQHRKNIYSRKGIMYNAMVFVHKTGQDIDTLAIWAILSPL